MESRGVSCLVAEAERMRQSCGSFGGEAGCENGDVDVWWLGEADNNVTAKSIWD